MVIERLGSRRVNYLSLVPTGEPCLDIKLGMLIKLLKSLGKPVAVFTNSSLLWRPDVREELSEADHVSAKLDTVDPRVWARLNRPHPDLSLQAVVRGIELFSREYTGRLELEVMLVAGLNDDARQARGLASLVSRLEGIAAVNIMVPVRPPAEPWVRPPARQELEEYVEQVRAVLGRSRVRVLADLEQPGYGGSRPSPLEDLLALLRVHPIPLERLHEYACSRGLDPNELLEQLKRRGVEVYEYQGRMFIRLAGGQSLPHTPNSLH